MKAILRDYPISAVALLLLACVKYEYQTTDWSISIPGLAGGLVVLCIIAMVLLYRIFNAMQDVCISRGLLHTRIRCKYDALIPIGIILLFIHARWCGEPFQGGIGKSRYRWEFIWSDPDWAVPFLAALVGVVLLIRILYLFRAIARESNVKSTDSL